MSVLVDWQIRELSLGKSGGPPPQEPLLAPFSEGVSDDGVISYGLTSCGYDLRMGTKAMIFKSTYCEMIDAKMMKKSRLHRELAFKRLFDTLDDLQVGEKLIMPPHSYVLVYSHERIHIPRYLVGTCVGKSTYARCGVIVNTTPLEPGWCGHLTIEIGNLTPCQVPLYVMEGICQMRLDTLDQQPETDYSQKGPGGTGGKYQNQGAEPVPARIKE